MVGFIEINTEYKFFLLVYFINLIFMKIIIHNVNIYIMSLNEIKCKISNKIQFIHKYKTLDITDYVKI